MPDDSTPPDTHPKYEQDGSASAALRRHITFGLNHGHCAGPALRAYFYSGWAFFVPYLVTYLVYAAFGLPANPLADHQFGPGGHRIFSIFSQTPPLLYVYWGIHLVNAVLAICALHSWRNSLPRTPDNFVESFRASPLNGPRSVSSPSRKATKLTTHAKIVCAVAPWAFLSLVFAIPSAYLEWPSDPWEHLRRITEWSSHQNVVGHTAGYKSFYFFAYSCIGWMPPQQLMCWLNVYFIATSLLLAWQYYLLAKAVGLDRRWAFLSVVANVLTFGNSCFSFYRYYALASTAFSQIGAVALTRIGLEYCKSSRGMPTGKAPLRGISASLNCYSKWLASSFMLLALVAFNHVQGLGIAGLGVGAVIVWRLVQWRRSIIVWLIAAAITMSLAAIWWWPRDPLIDSYFRTHGWLNVWYGFDLYSLKWTTAGAANRMIEILGPIGLLNIFAGILLLRRNHVLGWLTVMPVIALSLPFVTIPLSNSIVHQIVIFHRLFFAIPPTLALTYCITLPASALSQPISAKRWGSVMGTALAVELLLLLPNQLRLWHLVGTTPADLTFAPDFEGISRTAKVLRRTRNSQLIASNAFTYIVDVFHPQLFSFAIRSSGQAAALPLTEAIHLIRSYRPTAASERVSLTRDPLMTIPEAWTLISGAAPEFVSGTKDFSASSTALQNPSGRPSSVLTADTVAIKTTGTYSLEMSIRQCSGTAAVVYLAVAWYDATGRLLISNLPSPVGAGEPTGWNNGHFSYFGIYAASAPTDWTVYRVRFGAGTTFSIPRNATYIRVGALLNYSDSDQAIVRLTNVRLWETQPSDPLVAGIFPQNVQRFAAAHPYQWRYTPGSQAGQLSRHWSNVQVASDASGSKELEEASRDGSGSLVDPDVLLFALPSTGDAKSLQ